MTNFDSEGSAQIYRYSPANLNAIVQEADQPLTNGAFTALFPADSITLAVIPGVSDPDATGGSPTRRVFLPLVKR